MPTPQANVTHDIVIERAGTQTGFMLEPRSYRVARANDFAPRISTGKLTHSDFDTWFTIDLTGLEHGLGLETLAEDPMRFFNADPELETAVSGQLTLAAKWRESDPSFISYKFLDFGNYTFAGGDTKIRKYNPATDTWSDSKTDLLAPVTDMERGFNKLYVALGTGQDMLSCSDAAGDTWATETGRKGSCLRFWKAKLWRGNGGNLVAWDGTSDATVAVGDPQSNIVAIGAFENYLVIGKDDGKVYYYDGANVYDLIQDMPAYADNYKRMKYHQGWLYYPLLGDVMRMSGVGGGFTVQRVTPKMAGNDTWGWGLPVDLTASPRYVYVLFNLAENSYPVALKYNQEGWHKVWQGAASRTARAIYYSRVSGRIFVNDGSTWAQKVTTLTDSIYDADFDTASGKQIYLCHLTAGLEDITKVWRDVEILSENLEFGVVEIDLEYQADRSREWIAMGTVTVSPSQRIAFASGTAVEAKDMWLRLTLRTYDAAKYPKLRFPITVRYLPRPDTVYALAGNVICEDNIHLKDGTGDDEHTAAELLDELRQISDEATPVTMTTPDGLEWKVIMTNVGWAET